MIRPPSDCLKEQWGQTLAHVVLLALALAVPLVVAWGGLAASSSARQWMAAYRPAVYLASTLEAEKASTLEREIEGWEGVSEVSVRRPEEVMGRTRRQLGAERFDDLRMAPEVFPWELIVETSGAAGSDVELIARLSGLETRSTVDEVVVPERGASAWVQWGRRLAGSGLGLLGLGALLGVWMSVGYLRRLRQMERRELHLLEVFGAEPSRLRQASVVRGAIFGGLGGLLGGGISLGGSVMGRAVLGELFGGVVGVATWQSFLAAGPLAAGLLIGVFAGWWVARDSGEACRRATMDDLELESVLDHG